MTPASALLAGLRQGDLLSPEQLLEAERLAATLPSADALPAALVGRGWLTAYQAAELSEGRGAALVVGSYVLLDKLGEGGMGEVFRARHRVMGRQVALKRILTKRLDSSAAVERFGREVRAASLLSHPNVVQVHDAGEANGVHYLAMELLRGVNLADYLARRGPLPVTEAVDYVRQACEGMQHAHEKGLVHRDLKPANLWLTQQRQIKILDMGLALVADASTLTMAGGCFGTVDYVAPEQVQDSHKVDIRADVYSLGCTLYHLLTGLTPFADTHPAARPAMHLTQEPPPIEGRRADVPTEVADVVRKMMAKQREQRYQTPSEAANALAMLARVAVAGGGQPVSPQDHSSAPASGQHATKSLDPDDADVPATKAPDPEHEGVIEKRRPRQSRESDSTAAVPVLARAEPRTRGVRPLLLTSGIVGVLLLGLTLTVVLALRKGDNKVVGDKDKRPEGKDKGPVVVQGGPLSGKGENSIGMKFQLIPKGKFLMGSPVDDKDRSDNERQHEVTITRDFYLGTYEVTQKQYRTIMGYNPSSFSKDGKGSEKGTYSDSKPAGGKDKVEGIDTDDFPVENVSWLDAQEFLSKLNEQEKATLSGWECRLPTEAEWEFACRGGATAYQKYHFGDTLSPRQVHFDSPLSRPERVGSYPANKFGLHDMHGNVWEWCHDWYDKDYYPEGGTSDPSGPPRGSNRVRRGGSWNDHHERCRAAYRFHLSPSSRIDDLGFRVAVVPKR